MNEVLHASFPFDIPIILPLIGVAVYFLTVYLLTPNSKRVSWLIVMACGYLPIWCFRKYLDLTIALNITTVLFVAAALWASTTKPWPLVSRAKMVGFLSVPALSVTLLIVGGLYFDYLTPRDLFLVGASGAGSGNHFMWNFGLGWLFGGNLNLPYPTYGDNFWNTIGMFFFFFVYLQMFRVGIEIGRILFGRSEKQTGVFGLVPIPFLKDHK